MGEKKKKPYAAVAREKMLGAMEKKHGKENGERLRQQVEYAKEKGRLEGGGMQAYFEEHWKPLIDEAAEKENRESFLLCQVNPGDDARLVPNNRALLDVGILFLCNEGFGATFDKSYSPRVGSDDDYGNTTVVGITVTW